MGPSMVLQSPPFLTLLVQHRYSSRAVPPALTTVSGTFRKGGGFRWKSGLETLAARTCGWLMRAGGTPSRAEEVVSGAALADCPLPYIRGV